MSPSWRDHVTIVLHPQRLTLARVARGLRPRLTLKESLAVRPASGADAPWQPAIEALREAIATAGSGGAVVTLVLSSHFARYALAPWSELLKGEDEQQGFARHCFSQIYGAVAGRWAIRLAPGAAGAAQLACAVEQPLIDTLDEVMAPLGRRYRSLQPHLMRSFNGWRAHLSGGCGWFVVAEQGVLCLALLQRGEWRSVTTARVGAGWPAELPLILERESTLCDTAEECSDVFLFSTEDAPVALPASGRWRFGQLRPPPIPGFAPERDAAFALAVTG